VNTLDSAALISLVRHKAGLSQEELARRAGTSQPAVARYETGKASPSTSTLLRLLRAGGYDLDVQIRKASVTDLSGERARKVRREKLVIKSLMEKSGATNVRLFGSVARGEDTKHSDVDFLVDFDITQGLLPILKLNADLSKLLGERVEVAPVEALKREVLTSALSEAIPL
jgi:uncharacterized protein